MSGLTAGVLTETRVLGRQFYARDPVAVARELLGKVLVHGECTARIVEVEAYLDRNHAGEVDLAAHSSRGLTGRTRVIFGPPGHAYVYLIYGKYECLNVVTEREGTPGCVLIRALEPLTGMDKMRERRSSAGGAARLCSGPGRLTRAMGISRAHNGADLVEGSLRIVDAGEGGEVRIASGPRIGIRHCADWPLRFFMAGNASVSGARRASLVRL